MYYRRHSNWFKTTMIMLVSIFVGVVFTMYYMGLSGQDSEAGGKIAKMSVEDEAVQATENTGEDAGESKPVSQIVTETIPAVVGISTSQKVTERDVFRGKKNETETWSSGSGFIASGEGYIFTNCHVASRTSEKILVTLADGRVMEGQCLWSNEALDLAVVKIIGENLPYIKMGDINRVSVGETAIAVGNPLGLRFQRSVTKGIISAKDRTIEMEGENGENRYMEDLIQTDASINPGNSGGPLISQNGEVVGINTIKVTEAEGIGFAVPINVCKPILESFLRTGKFVVPYFGVFAYNKELGEYLTGESFDTKIGVMVADIDKNSPAYMGGIRKGDVITHINRIEINSMMDLREQIYYSASEGTVTVSYISEGKLKESQITLGTE